MNIYIASSWKNQHAVELLTATLRAQGHTIITWIENNYGEDHGPDKQMDFEAWMKTPSAERSFAFDTTGAMECDLFIYMSPGGKDAAAECGIAYGVSQKSAIGRPRMWALWAKGEDFGLMRNMFDRWFTRACDLVDAANALGHRAESGRTVEQRIAENAAAMDADRNAAHERAQRPHTPIRA